MSSALLSYRVLTTKEAKRDLREMKKFIEEHSTRRTAENYLARLKEFAAELAFAPVRGRAVAHFRPGTRRLGFERRVDIILPSSQKNKSSKYRASITADASVIGEVEAMAKPKKAQADDEFEEWLRVEVQPALAEIDADPSAVLSAEEVRTNMLRVRENYRNAGRVEVLMKASKQY